MFLWWAALRVASERLCVRENYFRSRIALMLKYRDADLARRAVERASRFAGDGLAYTTPI